MHMYERHFMSNEEKKTSIHAHIYIEMYKLEYMYLLMKKKAAIYWLSFNRYSHPRIRKITNLKEKI